MLKYPADLIGMKHHDGCHEQENSVGIMRTTKTEVCLGFNGIMHHIVFVIYFCIIKFYIFLVKIALD